MIYKSIFGTDLRSFIFNFNERMKPMFSNIDEKNCKFNQLEVKEEIAEPPAEAGKAIIYTDSAGALKIKFSDGTIKTFTLT